jgi:citrate/tricarballylate utilization protein
VQLDELTERGAHVMTVCNACRYCEQYCPVFPAMEERQAFAKVDLAFLANLCHNCGECLYACQYAPPHEFGINVPKTLAEIRVQSYRDYAWPQALGVAFTRHNLLTGLGLAAVLSALLAIATPGTLSQPATSGRLLRRRTARRDGHRLRCRLSLRRHRDGGSASPGSRAMFGVRVGVRVGV